MKQENIRNFSIIAHIDHGKSTLADRILEKTGAITEREKKDQLLDNMDIERERGITIKLNAVNLKYNYQGEEYILHLIDTPGHVDFSYEVSRSLAACEGAILVVDAAQGIEAQTLANLYLALDNNLTIIPVINKIDLPNADPEKVKRELIETLGFNEDEIVLTSAKNGIGIDELIETIIKKVPAPKGDKNKDLQALIFDSYFDAYRGIMTLVRVVNGKIKVKDKIKMLATGAVYEVVEIGIHTPHEMKKDQLVAGEVGYLCASIKSIEDVKVGDTITLVNSKVDQLPGYQPMKPMVFCGLYPIESSKYPDLREALEKLKLNDASLEFTPETSKALGFGFRCGFLGLLHMEIIEERIEREFGISLIATSPSVIYDVELTNGEHITVDSPVKMPEKVKIKDITYKVSSGKCSNRSERGLYPVYGSTGIIARTDEYLFDTEKLLIARVGANAGYVHIASGKYNVTDNTLIVDLKENIDLKFMYYYLQNFNLNQLAKGGGQPLITGGQIKELDITLPPIQEQKRISNILDKFDKLINDISEGLPAEIELRRKQYEYYRNKLLSFEELSVSE